MIRRFAITSGEPAGIGLDLCVQLAQTPQAHELVVLADRQALQERAQQLNLPLRIRDYQAQQSPRINQAGELCLLPLNCAQAVHAGELNPANAKYVIEMLSRACQGCLQQEFAAMITAPVHKGVINQAGIAFSGHTEFLRDLCNVPEVVMMLYSDDLKVALVTTHIPIKEVAQSITQARLERVLRILQKDLQHRFQIKHPHILVAGVNPHAGEGGHLGEEEITQIIPVLQRLNQQGFHLQGPLPADTLFTPKYLQQADVALAMYHDQGLPVLKYQSFGAAANVTLGLPIIRTSVDHGTACDLAGTGKAQIGSLEFALQAAYAMCPKDILNEDLV